MMRVRDDKYRNIITTGTPWVLLPLGDDSSFDEFSHRYALNPCLLVGDGLFVPFASLCQVLVAEKK